MNNLFAQSRSHWVRYDRYEIKIGKDGKRYITPEKAAKPDIYNPLKESSEMVLEALNVGMLMMNRRPEDVVDQSWITGPFPDNPAFQRQLDDLTQRLRNGRTQNCSRYGLE